jgi:putative ABC transport system substrate-binding protein
MRLIGLAVVLAVGLTLAPLAVEAQPPRKVAKIGVLTPSANVEPASDAFDQALQELGWVKGQNIRIERRYAAGRFDAFPGLAAELVGLDVDVLVAWSAAGALAAKRATTTIPVVFIGGGDPVQRGIVSNLARPGGNVTGISMVAALEEYAKRLELLKEAVPSLTRAALLTSPEVRTSTSKETMLAAAKALRLELLEVEVKAPAELEAAVRKAKEQGAQALYIWPSGFSLNFRRQLSDLALVHRLPSIHSTREGAMAGGLLSYGASLTDIARRGAAYVDKILRGAKPGDLPVEQPTKFELVINLKTANSLGLTIPQTLLLQADQVIQ